MRKIKIKVAKLNEIRKSHVTLSKAFPHTFMMKNDATYRMTRVRYAIKFYILAYQAEYSIMFLMRDHLYK